jgi:hypothetical protein
VRAFLGLRARLAATVLACLGVALVVGAQAAQAKVWHVNDVGDPGSPSGVCSPADCTLRAAIGNAQNTDTVEVPAGDYQLNPGNGPLNVMRSFTIAGAGAGKVTIDGKDATKVFYIQSDTVVTLQGVTVTRGNVGTSPSSGSEGGDIENNGTLTVRNSRIKNGTAFVGGDLYTTTSGGGVGVLNIVNSTVTGGTGAQSGGGVDYDLNTGGTIEGTTISNNQIINSDNSGGGGLYDRSNGLTIVNSTITGNTVNNSGFGGGIYDDDDFSLSIYDTTIAGNSNKNASNFYSLLPSPLRPPGLISTVPGFENTIIADPLGGGVNCSDGGTGIFPVSLGHNLESDPGGSCQFTSTGDQVGVDPQLRPLANNGGPTRTMALRTGSPAINGGATVKGLSTDQRGAPRPQPKNGAPDIGAYEYGAIVDLSISETAPHPVTVGHNLKYNLAARNNGPTQDGALGVRVTTRLPSSVSFASSSGACTNASGTVTCDLGTIAHGATKHVTITVVPQKVGFPVDKSSVSSGARDPKPANNRARLTVAVQDKPDAQTKASSGRTYHGAILHAKVRANNAQTVYHFEYGPTMSYGSTTTTGPAEGLSSIPVALPVSGLHPGRTYHYRIVATNTVGTSVGSDHTFFTYFLPVLHVSPARIRPGGHLRVYGNAGECPEGHTVTLLSTAFSYAHHYQGKGAIYTTVHHHGFFSTTTRIPSSRHRGTYPVSGLCGHFSGSAGDPGSAAAPARAAATRGLPMWSGRLRLS